MKTVLRDSNGEITWVHAYGNVYLTPEAHKILMEKQISIPMVEKTYGNPNSVISSIANNQTNPLAIKGKILTVAGLIKSKDIKIHNS